MEPPGGSDLSPRFLHWIDPSSKLGMLLIFHCLGEVNKRPGWRVSSCRRGPRWSRAVCPPEMVSADRAMTIVKFGESISRIEDRALLTGCGRYVDDVNFPGQAHGVLIYSSHAHARIKS